MYTRKQVRVEDFGAVDAVETLDVAILCWRTRISGYFWGAEGLSKDFLKPEEEEFGVGHPAQVRPKELDLGVE